jgi:hypothetical protein
VNVGLFGRPALAPSLWQDAAWGGQARKDLDDAVEACGGPARTRAVVVGSLLGGTGGGLAIPVLDHLVRDLRTSQVSAVFLGRYFDCPKEQADLYESNWSALGNEIRERYDDGGSFAIRRVALIGAEPSGLRRRDASQETQARRIPGPAADGAHADPLAEACWAMIDALNNLVPAAPASPEAAVIDVERHRQAIRDLWREAEARRDQAFAAIRQLSQPGFVTGVSADVFGGYLFGYRLLDFLGTSVARYAQATGPAVDFLPALERELQQVWSSGAYSLEMLFPPVSGDVSRSEFRRRAQRIPEPRLAAAQTKPEVLAVTARALLLALLRS